MEQTTEPISLDDFHAVCQDVEEIADRQIGHQKRIAQLERENQELNAILRVLVARVDALQEGR